MPDKPTSAGNSEMPPPGIRPSRVRGAGAQAEAGYLAAAASAQPGTERSADIPQPAAVTRAGRTRRFLSPWRSGRWRFAGGVVFEVCV
jgi:hypothetical protein